MRKYRFVWLDKKEHTGYGRDVADAFTRLGFGAGAMPALDYYEDITDKAK